MKIKKKDIELVQTCYGCPEQYDALYNGRIVGYLKLRWGFFRAETTFDDQIVYSCNTKGDGIFDEDERDFHLNKARKAIAKALNWRNKTLDSGRYNFHITDSLDSGFYISDPQSGQ